MTKFLKKKTSQSGFHHSIGLEVIDYSCKEQSAPASSLQATWVTKPLLPSPQALPRAPCCHQRSPVSMHPLFSSLWDGRRSRASVVSLLGLVFHPTNTWPLLVASLVDVLPSLSRRFSLMDVLPPWSLWSSLVDALPLLLLLEARLDFSEWMLRHQGLLLFNKKRDSRDKKRQFPQDESKYYIRPRKNAIHSVTF